MWNNTGEKVFEKGDKIVRILLKVGFIIKQSKVKGSAQEIQFLGIKWQDRYHLIPMDIINKITVMSSPTRKKKKKSSTLSSDAGNNDFKCGHEHQ